MDADRSPLAPIFGLLTGVLFACAVGGALWTLFLAVTS